MSAHTPGPWMIVRWGIRKQAIAVRADEENGIYAREIANITRNVRSEDECMADARLIAAAPRMLDAIRNIVSVTDDENSTINSIRAAQAHFMDVARAILRDVEGESNG